MKVIKLMPQLKPKKLRVQPLKHQSKATGPSVVKERRAIQSRFTLMTVQRLVVPWLMLMVIGP